MQKLFTEVFPSLNLSEGLIGIYKEVVVDKVVFSRSKQCLVIYITSGRLLHRSHLSTVESLLEKHLFKRDGTSVRFSERYQLSKQYDEQQLMHLYFSSILDELREVSLLEFNMLRQAKWEVKETCLVFTLRKTFISQMREAQVRYFIETIFRERFGLDTKIQFEYTEDEYEVGKERLEKRIEQEVTKVISEIKEVAANETAASIEKEIPNTIPDKKKITDPDMIVGKTFDGEAMQIAEVIQEMGDVIIRGTVISLATRDIKNEKTIISFNVTDFTDTITVKMFVNTPLVKDITDGLGKNAYVRIKGIAQYDPYIKEISLTARHIKKIPPFGNIRSDYGEDKRVELHAHTMMSDMDGVVDVKKLIKRAMDFGHKAIAITDHGVVQAFPEANHAVPKGSDFKVIYGVEAYLVDDLKEIVVNGKHQSLLGEYVVFDIETTGFGPNKDRIIEIGAVKIMDGNIVEQFSSFVNPERPIPYEIEKLTGIQDDMVIDAPKIDTVLPEFLAFCGDSVMVAHNASFDISFIVANADRQGIATDFTVIDTVMLARILLPHMNRYKLNLVAKELGVVLESHHRAVDDALATAEIFMCFIKRLQEREIHTLDALNRIGTMTKEDIKKLPTYHGIILAKNETGRKNLYRLISYSHIEYFRKRPRIPKSLLNEYREGLVIGSACEAGELYQAILRQQSEEEVARIVKYYDYLEIQPLDNNAFMIENDKFDIQSKDDLIRINQEIVQLGEEFNKPVVATCDVHFLDPEDEIYRRIIMAGQGFSDADNQAPLYFRTTEEMLKEFQYLGEQKAREVVIENTNLIADMIEKISPVLPDKYPPVIERSDEDLRSICYEKATSIYGSPLPYVVQERLDRELNSIISNGFAVMYIIAQKLVQKSNEDGYLVGSRGSVGSSFAATMAGITEVNPLSAHYVCPNCKFSDFDSEEVKKYTGSSGCDMPDKPCPECGTTLAKDGHDIPFETFLGFKGNKEPDIDLNFSGEYQSKAHDYTEEIFGKGQVFRAGTIGTMAEKTAYGYIKKYYEERSITKREAEVNRLVLGCTGIRRTTGQHPGGIIVVPRDQEIYSFTPIQRPANDMHTKTITTHFDYHSIDHNLLKLDILGHDDPTMIRMLEDLTGIDAKLISLDDPKVLSLFESTNALGVTPEEIGGCKLGSLGIPEFGTDFVIQMLIDTKPKTFSHLVRISGLSHGTDVWLNNAQTLIQEGKAELSTCICTRDDIMGYLIQMGMDKELAFTIMESVRKGKGLKPDWEEAMIAADVPDWYIWSCKTIKYMFPKAHAVAYVMMAFRIAYFKVYYPLAYYTAFFSIRASAFSYELMCQGKERLNHYIQEYKRKGNELTNKEKDTLKDMRIVYEMYARGYQFAQIDIYNAKANDFQIIDNQIMPALSSIEGLGEKAAMAIEEASKEGPYLSIDDFRQRTKVSKTVIELMQSLEILNGLPESNQLSFF